MKDENKKNESPPDSPAVTPSQSFSSWPNKMVKPETTKKKNEKQKPDIAEQETKKNDAH